MTMRRIAEYVLAAIGLCPRCHRTAWKMVDLDGHLMCDSCAIWFVIEMIITKLARHDMREAFHDAPCNCKQAKEAQPAR